MVDTLWLMRVGLIVCVCTSLASAQPPGNSGRSHSSTPPAPGRTQPRRPFLSEHQERVALAFARQHHPELADLLKQLKANNRPAYRRGIRELFETRRRLVGMRERSPQRYDLALRAWKLDSRIKLMAARMTMSQDPELEAELKAALLERIDLRKELLIDNRERLEARLKRINQNIEELESHREQRAQRQLQHLKRKLGLSSPRAKPRTKPRGAAAKARPQQTAKPQPQE